MPLFLIEYQIDREINSFPMYSRRVAILDEKLQQQGIELAYCRVEYSNQPIGVWFLGAQYHTSQDVLRRLRVHLFRVHALRESLKHVLRSIIQGNIKVIRDSEPTETLQAYLNDAFGVLTRESFYGIQQSGLLETAYSLDKLINEGDRATLLHQLEKIRGNLLKKVLNGTQNPPGSYVIYSYGRESRFYLTGGGPVNEKSVNVNTGGGDITGSAIGFENMVKDSFNTIERSNAPVEIQTLLKELTNAAAAMCSQIPDETLAKQTASDVQTFVTEATSKAPRKNILAAFADSLANVAKTVEKVGPPVISLTGAVLKLLA